MLRHSQKNFGGIFRYNQWLDGPQVLAFWRCSTQLPCYYYPRNLILFTWTLRFQWENNASLIQMTSEETSRYHGWWHVSLTERAKSRWIESASGMCLPGWLSMLGPFRISSAKHQGKQSIGLGGARESSWETNKSVDLKARLYQLMLQLTLFYTHSLCKSHIAFAI